MAQLVLTFCLLGLFLSGCCAQVTQPPTASVSPRGTVQLSCTLGGSYTVSSNRVVWIQQKQGNAPRFLLYFFTESNKGMGSGVPSRFSGSRSGSDKEGYLTITGALEEDDAVYYCATWTGSAWLFGSGTQLTVLGQPKASPTVHLFPPSSEELSTQSKATLVCLMDNFYPGSVQVTWKADGAPITSGVETTKPSKQSNNQYMASSYLKLSASEWKSHESYTCLVTHDGKSTDKTLKRSECS